MPFDPSLAERLEKVLKGRHGFEQKKMFGGLGWMLHGNMWVGIYKDWLITRVGEICGRRNIEREERKTGYYR